VKPGPLVRELDDDSALLGTVLVSELTLVLRLDRDMESTESG